MTDIKNVSRRITLYFGLLVTSTHLSADHNNPLTDFSLPPHARSNGQGYCADDNKYKAIESLCSTQTTDGSAFDTKPILSISIQVDIRPETCVSFFDDYLHTRRGLRIESALNTIPKFNAYTESVSTFPVIDFIGNGHAHVVKSKDLTTHIYSPNTGSNALYESIIADAEDIDERFLRVLAREQFITASVHGITTTIRAGDINEISLNIIIQSGMATPDQINQIKRANIEIRRRWGFKLEVIEIP